MAAEVMFLFDVDNTMLDNDAFQDDLRAHLTREYGDDACGRYWFHFEELRRETGYADYLAALERFRLEEPHNSRLLRMANWLLDYPFAELLFPGAFDAVEHVRRFGPAAILSDGDAVFQPRKIEQSGLWSLFGDNVLIYVHKQKELTAVEKAFPARHYVLVDDKLVILDAVKRIWGERVTTVFPRQGHYAFDTASLAGLAPADITIDRIADLRDIEIWPPERRGPAVTALSSTR